MTSCFTIVTLNFKAAKCALYLRVLVMNPSVWDLQQMLKSERKACQSLKESISQWKNIVEGMGASTPDVNALESEWKVRFVIHFL